MGAENFVNVSQAGKRSAKRARVLLAVKIRTCGAEIDARLRDLSQKGALIECSSPLAVDEEVVFSRGSTVVPARVAWAGAGKVGLEFKRMIDESEVLVQLGRGAQPARPALPQAAHPWRGPVGSRTQAGARLGRGGGDHGSGSLKTN